jgi:hypothetical protein
VLLEQVAEEKFVLLRREAAVRRAVSSRSRPVEADRPAPFSALADRKSPAYARSGDPVVVAEQPVGKSTMTQSDTSAQSAIPDDADILSPSRMKWLLLKQLPYLLVLLLTIFGVALTSQYGEGVATYWQFLAVAMGVVCIGTGWLHNLPGPARFRMVWTQVLHWLAFSAAMMLVHMSGVQSMVSANATGLALLMLLALGTFVAGVHVSWHICVLGIAMALFVPAIAWLQQSALFLLLGATVVVGIIITFLWSRSGAPKGEAAARS